MVFMELYILLNAVGFKERKIYVIEYPILNDIEP